MALKTLNVKTNAEGSKSKKDNVPSTVIASDLITRLNEADTAAKDAKALRDELALQVREIGLDALVKFNVQAPVNPVTSMKVIDEDGEVARIAFTEKYGNPNLEQLNAAFEGMSKDINEYVLQTVKAKFNTAIFVDKDGNFNEGKFNAYMEAMAKLAQKFGDVNPLATETVVAPKPNFHANRWGQFTAEQQKTLIEVLPNTITVTANAK